MLELAGERQDGLFAPFAAVSGMEMRLPVLVPHIVAEKIDGLRLEAQG